MQQTKSTPSFAGQFLKSYRASHQLTQEQLAYEIAIEPRTLRAYENGERQLNNIKEIRRIAEMLGVEPELMGVSPGIYVPKTAHQIDAVVTNVWKMLDEPRVTAARNVIEKLIADTAAQAKSEDDPAFLRSLALAYHVAGYASSLGTRTSEVARPISYYHQLEEIARIIDDDTLLNIALTYQGDMYRRHKEIDKAIEYLEAARDITPNADVSARGNALQLLGRAYLIARNRRGFQNALDEAEDLAYQINPETDSTRGQYNLAAVYEEYGKNYGILGEPQNALDYLEKAEATRPRTKFWETLLTITRAEVLIYNGDVASGKPLAIEAARISKAQGHRRRLERIYAMKRYLSRKIIEYGKAESELSEILDGPVEQWDSQLQ